MADNFVDKAKETVEDVRSRVGESVEDMSNAAEDKTQAWRDQANQAVGEVKGRVDQARTDAEIAADNADEDLDEDNTPTEDKDDARWLA